MAVIKELDAYDIHQANYNSFGGTRGDSSNAAACDGTLKIAQKEGIYSNDDFNAYEYNDRVFIKFTLKPQRQLIVALKSRGYWWNAHEGAWSTYADKADREWIKTISERYGKYV